MEEAWDGEGVGGHILGQGLWVSKWSLVAFSSWLKGKAHGEAMKSEVTGWSGWTGHGGFYLEALSGRVLINYWKKANSCDREV